MFSNSKRKFIIGAASLAMPAIVKAQGWIPLAYYTNPWTPQILSKYITGWYDAQRAVVLNGTTVSQWNDNGPIGNNAPGIGAAQPSYSLFSFNGKPGLTYAGSQILTAPMVVNGNKFVCYGVAQLANSSVAFGRILSLGQSTLNDFDNQSSAAVLYRNNATNAVATLRANSGPSTSAIAVNTPFIFGSKFDSLNETVSINGVNASQFSSTGNFNTLSLGIGGEIGPSGLVNFSGVLGEVICFNQVLNAADELRVYGYLAWKWGLVSLLPTSSPYKLNPPAAVPTTQIANVVYYGTSRTSGVGASSSATTYPSVTQTLLPPNFMYNAQNISFDGATTTTLLTNYAGNGATAFKAAMDANVMIIEGGINDTGVITAAQSYANIKAIAQAALATGYKVVVSTEPAAGGTGADQTFITTVNNSVISGWQSDIGAQGLADFWDAPHLHTAADSSNLTYYQADALHLIDAGQAIMAGVAAPIITPLL